MKKMQSWVKVITAVLLSTATLAVPPVQSAVNQDITITVTIRSVSVSVSDGAVAFGSVDPNSDTVNPKKQTVTNNGNATENFSMKLTNPSGWTAGSTAGNNVYVLSGLFTGTGDSQPVATDFGSEDVIATTKQTATTTIFAKAGASANGAGVASSTAVALWFKFRAPTDTNVSTQQSIAVTVGAESAS